MLEGKLSYRSFHNNFSSPILASYLVDKINTEAETKKKNAIKYKLQKEKLENVKSNYFYASSDSLLMMRGEFVDCSIREQQYNFQIIELCLSY